MFTWERQNLYTAVATLNLFLIDISLPYYIYISLTFHFYEPFVDISFSFTFHWQALQLHHGSLLHVVERLKKKYMFMDDNQICHRHHHQNHRHNHYHGHHHHHHMPTLWLSLSGSTSSKPVRWREWGGRWSCCWPHHNLKSENILWNIVFSYQGPAVYLTMLSILKIFYEMSNFAVKVLPLTSPWFQIWKFSRKIYFE